LLVVVARGVHFAAAIRCNHFCYTFPGINYRANVWVNGKKIADAKDVAGTFRIFEFDVTSALNTNGQNAVALEIFAPREK